MLPPDEFSPVPAEWICAARCHAAREIERQQRDRFYSLTLLDQHGGTFRDLNEAAILAQLARARWEWEEAEALHSFWDSAWWVRWPMAARQDRVRHFLRVRAYLGDALLASGPWW